MMRKGVTAAKGFYANGVHAGIKAGSNKPDVAMIYSDVICNAAAIYTTNLVKGAPIRVTAKNLENGKAQAVICNSGNANTCNSDGIEKAEEMCSIAAEKLNISDSDVIVASTGVIGQKISTEPVRKAADALVKGLTDDGSERAALAIMTTDTIVKEAQVRVIIGGHEVTIGGISKGSGMIHPNMATMLCFITTDASVSSDMLKKMIKSAADESFHMLSVDRDTSTNDTLAIMANGLAGNPEITEENDDYRIFLDGLTEVCRTLAKLMAGDGEGASKLIICRVNGAKDKGTARTVAKSVICSNLLKAAMFGADANWGRVLCAIGYSGADVDISKIDVSFKSNAGRVDVCKGGYGIDFSEEEASKVLGEKEITILVSIGDGEIWSEAYGCDLTYDYVKINGDYRS
jgi:glutamate N-acetyltransferase/amino-acid N-acetyltransferase